ncbi:MAG: AAA family ATPase [Candidatus Bathyarchaeota archaeon]
MLIREVILENFMSYEYARIPFRKGVNVVCGPNGSGKSSILLGISVALGQSSTERSKRLSDLIRYGKEEARVTLVLDNSIRDGQRPVRKIKKDQIFLTRNLRKDGKYWFELENTAANKIEVNRLLAKFEVDPENMLIIMHQNMVNQLSVISAQEKLQMVEEVVGFESYRKNVSSAKKKLSRLLSQGDSVEKLLQSAEQTLIYWREQYDRYQQKKQLIIKRRFLERELTWAEVLKQERIVTKLKNQYQDHQEKIKKIDTQIKTTNIRIIELQTNLNDLRITLKNLFEERIIFEQKLAKLELAFSTINQFLKETQSRSNNHSKGMDIIFDNTINLKPIINGKITPDLNLELNEIKASFESLEDDLKQQFKIEYGNFEKTVESSSEHLRILNLGISDINEKLSSFNNQIKNFIDELIDNKINLALLIYQKEQLSTTANRLDKELQTSIVDLKENVDQAKTMGKRIVPTKTTIELLEELRVTDGHLNAMTDVSGDIERMYESYSKLYLELKEKARLVAENREKALEEVKSRTDAWRTVMHQLLDKINFKYKKILADAYAVGEVKLTNEEDIEDAGLEINVGFKGGKPVPLNAYTQSGGERSTATVTFLLALQQFVNSPFRAVDEYDVHMDPKNREIIANLIVSSVTSLDSQYLAITPSQLTFTGKDVHLITVQNVEGTSLIREVS